MVKKSNWSEELVKQLLQIHSEGKYSTKQIGEILGFTKNAIVGKIHRLGVGKHNNTNLSDSQVQLNVKNSSKNKSIKKPNNKKSSVQTVPKVLLKLKKPGEYLLEEIEYDMCVWPYGDEHFTFCGERVLHGKAYCKDHMKMAYLKIARVDKRKQANLYTEDDLDEESI